MLASAPSHVVAAGRAPSPPTARRAWLWGLLLVAGVILAYQPAWRAGFIWDDDDYVTENPLLTAPDGLRRIWFSTDAPSQYFPLVYTTLRLEHALWGLNPLGYHGVNIMLHAANALIVWQLLQRLRAPGAWLAAAIFALHPVQVESVAWVTELKNVQSLFFFLLALLAWMQFVAATESRPRADFKSDDAEPRIRSAKRFPRWTWYVLALAFHALALFSKTTACTLPAALLLVLWWQHRTITRRRMLEIVPFVLLGIAMGLVSMWWERNRQGTVGQAFALGFWERGLIAGRAVWFYLGKLVWPANLTFSYPRWSIDPSDPLAYLWLAASAAVAALIVFVRRHVGRGVEVAALFFVATLSPVLGFIMLYTFLYTFVADHYQYSAMVGPVALAAAGLTWGTRKLALADADGGRRVRWAAVALGAMLLVGLATLTWRQARMYRDVETLWQTTIERNPRSFMAYNNLGLLRLNRGEREQAVGLFERALEVEPNFALGHCNLGWALFQLDRLDEATTHFEKALALWPKFPSALNDLGLVALKKGRPDEALRLFRDALAVQPKLTSAEFNLGHVLLGRGAIDEAAVHLARAAAAHPKDGAILADLGLARLQQGKLPEAIADLEQALAGRSNHADVHANLGYALLQQARIDEAIGHFERSLAEKDDAETRVNLGNALLQKGRVADAIAEYRRAVAGQPELAMAHNNLGWALLQSGDVNAAIRSLERALALQPGYASAQHNLDLALGQKRNLTESASSGPEHQASASTASETKL